ncbi:MAG: serine aminopeptidase domain-containing protein [Actinomycetota bacterium]
MSSQKAVRAARDGSYHDVIEFVGEPGAQMLTTTHLPVGTPVAGLVVCSSLRAEFETNYRREILLGRTLAAAGIAVRRFQYLGTGNSDGETRAVTFDQMVADAERATGAFLESTGLERIAFMGTRLGGTIAAAAAASRDGAPVVLWEPVVEVVRYYRQIFRARKMWVLGGSDEIQTETATAEFERTGFLDIVGYPIDRNLYDSAIGHDVAGELTGARRVLVVQMGGRHGLKREYAALGAAKESEGYIVTSEVVDEDESWWLEHPGERQEKRTMNSSPAIDATVTWLKSWASGAEVAA